MARIAVRQALGAVTSGLLLWAGLPAPAQEAATPAEVLRGTHVHGLAFDPKDPDRLLVATHHGLHALDLATGTLAPVGESRQDFMGFSVAAEDRLLASGHPAMGGNSGVLLSTDGGATWTPISEGAEGPVDFHQMTASAADPDTLYGAYAGNLQRSRDGGASWEVVGPAPARLIDLAASSTDPDRLYAATEGGLLASDDGGLSWGPAHPAQAPVTFVEAGPDGALHAFVLGEGLTRAEEGDLDWTLVSEPMGGDYLLHFATDGTRAAAATGSGVLLLSDTGGAEWRLP